MAQKARAASPARKGLVKKTLAAPDGPAPDEGDITHIAARLSPTELDEFAAALSDEALASLVLAAARQLRRRLVRGGGRKGQRSSAALERAARQLAAELHFPSLMRHGGTGGGSAWSGIEAPVEHLSRRPVAQAPARGGVELVSQHLQAVSRQAISRGIRGQIAP